MAPSLPLGAPRLSLGEAAAARWTSQQIARLLKGADERKRTQRPERTSSVSRAVQFVARIASEKDLVGRDKITERLLSTNVGLMYHRDVRRRISPARSNMFATCSYRGSGSMKDQRKNVPKKSCGLPVEADELVDTQLLDESPTANLESDGCIGNDDDTREMPKLSTADLERMGKAKKSRRS